MTGEHKIDQFVRERYFADVTSGVLIEVGAAGPSYLSVGETFRTAGWHVVSVEPNPQFCAAHRALGHDILEYAVSDKDEDDVPFTVIDSHGAEYEDGCVSFESFSSLGIRDNYADLYKTVRHRVEARTILVKVRTLDTILKRHRPNLQMVTLIVVDVEGWELNVMRGFSANLYKPKVIILENLFNEREYIRYMGSVGYDRACQLGPNDIYIRRFDRSSGR